MRSEFISTYLSDPMYERRRQFTTQFAIEAGINACTFSTRNLTYPGDDSQRSATVQWPSHAANDFEGNILSMSDAFSAHSEILPVIWS